MWTGPHGLDLLSCSLTLCPSLADLLERQAPSVLEPLHWLFPLPGTPFLSVYMVDLVKSLFPCLPPSETHLSHCSLQPHSSDPLFPTIPIPSISVPILYNSLINHVHCLFMFSHLLRRTLLKGRDLCFF